MERSRVEAVNDMFSIAQSYIDHTNFFVYGSKYTAMDFITGNEIDCSSFISLLLNGVYYEKSRYTGNLENQMENIEQDIPKNRLYANQIAQYASEHRYAYFTDDYSEILPGDFVFFSFDYSYADVESGKISESKYQFHENAYRMIDHVGVAISQKDDNHLTIAHGNDYDVISIYDVCLHSDKTDSGNDNPYKDAIVICARFPFELSTPTKLSPCNLLQGGSERVKGDYYSLKNITRLVTYELNNHLKARRTYTMTFTAKFHTTVAHGRCYMGLYGMTELHSMYPILSWKYIREPANDRYVLYFVTPHNVIGNKLSVYMLGDASSVPNHSRSGEIENACLYEGFHR